MNSQITHAAQGSDAGARPIILDVSGMTCAACATRLEKVLSRADGVTRASVNYAVETAVIEGRGLDLAGLVGAVEGAGFSARERRDTARERRLAEEEREAEQRGEERRTLLLFLIAVLASLPLIVPMMLMPFGVMVHLPVYLELALATLVQVFVGQRFYRGAFAALRSGGANMDVLVALGTSAAYFYSLTLVVRHGEAVAGHLYFEASAVILTLVLFGKLMEMRARKATTSALRKLMALRPDSAVRLLDGGAQETVAVEALLPGDKVLVRPGERLPVDGRILEGVSEIDESLVTGESMPQTRGPDARVIAGSINGTGALTLEVKATGDETELSRIVALVETAQRGKAPVQKLVDRISAIFVPLVLVIGAATFGGWLLTGADLEQALSAAVSVWVIACPCALGLATPTALVAGTGSAARAGILIRDIGVLERLGSVKAVVFDKTGTLTVGHPVLASILPVRHGVGDDLLLLAASVQERSEHPLARAVVDAARDKGMTLIPATAFRAIPGKGAIASVGGRQVAIGNRKLLAELEIDTKALTNLVEQSEKAGRTTVAVAVAGEVVGLLAFEDRPREEAAGEIARLKARGLTLAMMTGDAVGVATRVGRALGLEIVEAGLLPGDKSARVALLEEKLGPVAMVGDGINDAPALSRASVGIAMGSGADVALETAGVTLMRSDLSLVPAAFDVSARTSAKIRQNLGFAFIFNVIGIPVAAMGLLSPAFAGAAMAASSVLVVSNAALLARWKPARGASHG